MFATGGMQFLDKWHLISGTGFRLPTDRSAENQVWYWSNHIDRQLGESGWYLLGELNWHHWMSNGKAFPLPVEGVDLINLGSVGVAGNNIVTGALGIKYRFENKWELGGAWEPTLTDEKGVSDHKIIATLNLRY